MKHAGKAQQAAFRLILLSLCAVAVILVIGLLAKIIGAFVIAFSSALVILWILFVAFTLYFFRDPEPRVPAGAGLVISPAHARIDAIGATTESDFMGGECQRISMFLSVIDVHVQNAPVGGRVGIVKHTPGQYLNAMKAESAQFNENVLMGFDSDDPAGGKIGVRVIAGVLARRIIPWVKTGDTVARGERISLVQYGSRADVYLPKRAKIKVKLGDKVVGGETVLAAFE